jgi:alpha-L-arabinofuranosidase
MEPSKMRKLFLSILFGILPFTGGAQNKVVLSTDSVQTQINKNIYGHFAEDLGRCIYGGFFVGKGNTTIPNTDGIRNDVIKALKDLKIPNLRWPGGCYADTYHWKDAIGPQKERKPTENLAWGNVREDNSFGTTEFLNMCELLGAEPYLAVNMNTGTVEEAVEWVQYANHANGTSFLTDMREKNGRTKPWNVKFWGIGNESWDCGGNMSVEHYINLYKQFTTAMTSYGNTEKLFRVAVGPGGPGNKWTEEIMKNIPSRRFEGLSIHHYAVTNWGNKSSSTKFTNDEYFKTMQQAWRMENVISSNSEIMDKYDPKKRVAMIIDEWGGWYETDPEGNGQLYQQNTMRDAMIAGLTLNIFNNHADRVRMANLAQMVNVLQSVILTNEQKIILTPTYHVMEMYNVHQDAKLVPVHCTSNDFVMDNRKIPAVSVSASQDPLGKIHISLTNIDQMNSQSVEIDWRGFQAKKITGRILTSSDVHDHNTFESPTTVEPKIFNDFSISRDYLKITMPPISVIVLELGS